MAYKIIRDRLNMHQTGREITAVLDSEADLTTLQANEPDLAPGSLAIIADAGLPSYALNASGEWKSVDDDGSSGGGGANPNSIETYTGTAENIFTSNGLKVRDIATAWRANELSVKLIVDGSAIGVGAADLAVIGYVGDGSEAWTLIVGSLAAERTLAMEAVYGDRVPGDEEPFYSDGLEGVQMMTPDTQGQFINGLATVKDLPATLTIIRHPLPESTTGGNA